MALEDAVPKGAAEVSGKTNGKETCSAEVGCAAPVPGILYSVTV